MYNNSSVFKKGSKQNVGSDMISKPTVEKPNI